MSGVCVGGWGVLIECLFGHGFLCENSLMQKPGDREKGKEEDAKRIIPLSHRKSKISRGIKVDNVVIFCLGHVCFVYHSGVSKSVYTVFILLSMFVPMLCI